jgi:glutamyl-tRNA reductase
LEQIFGKKQAAFLGVYSQQSRRTIATNFSSFFNSRFMNIVVVGLNHRTAPVEVRERFAVPSDEIKSSLNSFVGDGVIREVVVLSTCNRVEVYAVCKETVEATNRIYRWLESRSGLNLSSKDLYTYELPRSVQHLYEVGSGLDSMVVGETEILGQVKSFYHLALDSHRTGLALNRLFQSAFSVAKEIRTKTRIGVGSVSVGSVAVDLAYQIFGELKDRSVLLIGAGEMGETTAKFLKSRGVDHLFVTNRSFEKADALAKQLDAKPVKWENLFDQATSMDILISSTAAPQPILTKQKFEAVVERRPGTPLFLIDIAVPRDIEREVGQLRDVYLYDIDDLQVIADQNLAARQNEIAVCKQIVREHVDKYETWFVNHRSQIEKCPTARQMDAWRKLSQRTANG